MTTTRISVRRYASLAVFLSACAAPRPAPAPEPVIETPAQPAPPPVVMRAPLPDPNPALPPVPPVAGPLEIKVVYPPANQVIQSRDSNFVFGSVGNGEAGLTINGILAPVWPNGAFMAWLPNPPAESPQYDIVATTGLDTARLIHPIKLLPPPPATPPAPDTITPISPAKWAALIGPAAYPSDTDRVVTGYALTGGIQRWFLMPETRVQVTGTRGNNAYVELDSSQKIRIEMPELRMLDSVARRRSLRASPFTLRNAAEWTDIVIPVRQRPAFLVEQPDTGTLTLTFYGTSAIRRQAARTGSSKSYVKKVSVARSGPQLRYTITTRGPVFGYQPLWEKGKFTLRVRKPPAIDSVSPLNGLTITIDAGHPPVGATGPTGLWEPEVTLPVALKAQELLQAKGANVVMTRTTPEPVQLNLRQAIARRTDSDAFVSFHLNAVPDGTNPFRAQGTATYHYHPLSSGLAEWIQRAAVEQMSLPDNGVKRENFAVVRGTWMPSVLVEGAFIIMPDQEAALRTSEYQARYAQAVVDGLEAFFKDFASKR